MARHVQNESHHDEIHNQRGAAITDEWKRHAGRRQQIDGDPDIDHRFKGYRGRQPGSKKAAELIFRLIGNVKPPPQNDHIQAEREKCAQQAQLLSHNGEDEVVVSGGKEKQLLLTLAETDSDKPSRANSLHGLDDLVGCNFGILGARQGAAEPGLDALI